VSTSITAGSRPKASRTEGWVRAAAWTVRLAGVVGVIGIVFLVGMFAAFAADARSTGLVLGLTNDVLVLVSYLLLTPSVVAVFALTRARSPALAAILAILGVGGIAWVVLLQGLLVVGVLTFEQEIGPVSIGYLALAAWFVAGGWLVGRSGAFRPGAFERGGWMGLLGATYLGFPLWAFWIGRRFRRHAESLPLGSLHLAAE